ncbi:MAG: AMP-binding protein [Elusimicrobiota bacterium]|nr:AMP-binding protein [Elusimicrobiota bacterium]
MKNWDRLAHLSWKELKDIQNRKLRSFISSQVYAFSPYYRNLFDKHKIKPQHIKTAEDLKIIPFTTKNDLLPTETNPTRFRDFIFQPDKKLIKKHWPLTSQLKLLSLGLIKGKDYVKELLEKEYKPIFMTATTGTTNLPTPFFYSDYDINNLKVIGYRLLNVFGFGRDARAVNFFPYAPHLAFWQTVFAGFAHNNFVLSTGGGKVTGTDGNIGAILKFKPEIIIGVPDYIYHIVRCANEKKMSFSSIKKVVLGASRIPLGFKEKLSSMLAEMGAKDVSIFGTYGFTEAKYAWAECPTEINISSGYHTYPDKEIFEVIDPDTGEVKAEGEDGELVYTSLDARGSCVLRYRTGDLAKGGIIYSKCPHCSKTVPRISSDIVRSSNIKDLMFSKIKGTLVNLNIFEHILADAKEIDEWQIEIRKKNNNPYEIDELVVYICLKNDVNKEKIKEDLANSIKLAAEISPNEIIVLSREEILKRIEMETSHKVKRLIDSRPKI